MRARWGGSISGDAAIPLTYRLQARDPTCGALGRRLRGTGPRSYGVGQRDPRFARGGQVPRDRRTVPRIAPLMQQPTDYDFLIVGAGYAGVTIAERLTRTAGQRVLVVDRRDHIAGNAYDYVDEHGVLVHKYG